MWESLTNLFWKCYFGGYAFDAESVDVDMLVDSESIDIDTLKASFYGTSIKAVLVTDSGNYILGTESRTSNSLMFKPIEANFKVDVKRILIVLNSVIISDSEFEVPLNRGDALNPKYSFTFSKFSREDDYG